MANGLFEGGTSGTNLGVVTTTYGAPEDRRWLGKALGTNSNDSITLYGPAFLTAYPTGVVPSGTPIAKYTSGAHAGLYGPYTTGASDGTQTGTCLTFSTIDLQINRYGSAVPNVSTAMFWHGEVIQSKLPGVIAVDSAFKTALNQIHWV